LVDAASERTSHASLPMLEVSRRKKRVSWQLSLGRSKRKRSSPADDAEGKTDPHLHFFERSAQSSGTRRRRRSPRLYLRDEMGGFRRLQALVMFPSWQELFHESAREADARRDGGGETDKLKTGSLQLTKTRDPRPWRILEVRSAVERTL